MNEQSSPRTQALIALFVVILAALLSWKLFYHDPHAELSRLDDQVSALSAGSQQEPSQAPKLYTADPETIKAARSAATQLSQGELRRRVQKDAAGAGLTVTAISSPGGRGVHLSASGPDTAIAKFLTDVEGSLRLEDGQIRGSGPPITVTSAAISGKTPQTETIQVVVSSGT